MSFESDLYAVLSGAAGLTALVGARIVPSHEPSPVAPYVVYTPVFGGNLYVLSGASDMERVRVQVDCYAEDTDTAAAIALAVIAAIPQTGSFCRTGHSNQDLGLEENTRLYRRMCEFSIFRRT